ncbi:unnamed protein product, partial [Ixodes hexagonus]
KKKKRTLEKLERRTTNAKNATPPPTAEEKEYRARQSTTHSSMARTCRTNERSSKRYEFKEPASASAAPPESKGGGKTWLAADLALLRSFAIRKRTVRECATEVATWRAQTLQQPLTPGTGGRRTKRRSRSAK